MSRPGPPAVMALTLTPVSKPNPIARSHRQRATKRKITKKINKSSNKKKKEITTILLQDPPQDLTSVGNQASKQDRSTKLLQNTKYNGQPPNASKDWS